MSLVLFRIRELLSALKNDYRTENLYNWRSVCSVWHSLRGSYAVASFGRLWVNTCSRQQTDWDGKRWFAFNLLDLYKILTSLQTHERLQILQSIRTCTANKLMEPISTICWWKENFYQLGTQYNHFGMLVGYVLIFLHVRICKTYEKDKIR